MAAPGTAEAPPRLGDGCLARYDLPAGDETLGADFSAAAALWRRLQAEREAVDVDDEAATQSS